MAHATLSQAQYVLALLKENNIPEEGLRWVLEEGLLVDLIEAKDHLDRENFRECLGLNAPMPEIFTLSPIRIPGADQTLEHRIAAGEYSWVDQTIRKGGFTLTIPEGPRTLFYVQFSERVTTEKVARWANKNGYEFAFFDDLLAVGENTARDSKLRIVALGSGIAFESWYLTPVIVFDGPHRALDLVSCKEWAEDFLFLMYRKKS